jgi:hypothetical protein
MRLRYWLSALFLAGLPAGQSTQSIRIHARRP